MQQLNFIALNEINFDFAKKYVEKSPSCFPNFEKLFNGKIIETRIKDDYDHIEPWIVWPSVLLGQDSQTHNIFYLGDGAHSKTKSIFSLVESLGFKVGVISPINSGNDLASPAFFIPDPWIETKSDSSMMSRIITSIIRSAVNSNASSRLRFKTIAGLILILSRFARPKNYTTYVKYAISARKRTWYRSLFFDLLMFDIYSTLIANKDPHLSYIFLNAGAHIQHHHMFSSEFIEKESEISEPRGCHDAVSDMLKAYDRILGQCFEKNDQNLIIATGLTQIPYDREKYYYRPRDHAKLMSMMGVQFKKILPRMSRDFEIVFADSDSMKRAENLLKAASIGDGEYSAFRLEKIDALRVFVTLIYSRRIDPGDLLRVEGVTFPIYDAVDFVALKNGMHSGKGWAFLQGDIINLSPEAGSHPKELFVSVKSLFEAAAFTSGG